ncbi:unnamed protein product [Musa banksii]
MKHSQYNREPINPKFRIAEPMNMPILTADPSIMFHHLEQSDSFLIFASDGLWEHLSDQKAVEIVHSHPRAVSIFTSLLLLVSSHAICFSFYLFFSFSYEEHSCIFLYIRYFFSFAKGLIKAALHEAARKREMRYSDLKRIDKKVRRHFHDDITVIIIFLNHEKEARASKTERNGGRTALCNPRSMSCVEEKMTNLRRRIPHCESMELDGLFLEVAGHIMCLQLQVKVIQMMVKAFLMLKELTFSVMLVQAKIPDIEKCLDVVATLEAKKGTGEVRFNLYLFLCFELIGKVQVNSCQYPIIHHSSFVLKRLVAASRLFEESNKLQKKSDPFCNSFQSLNWSSLEAFDSNTNPMEHILAFCTHIGTPTTVTIASDSIHGQFKTSNVFSIRIIHYFSTIGSGSPLKLGKNNQDKFTNKSKRGNEYETSNKRVKTSRFGKGKPPQRTQS